MSARGRIGFIGYRVKNTSSAVLSGNPRFHCDGFGNKGKRFTVDGGV